MLRFVLAIATMFATQTALDFSAGRTAMAQVVGGQRYGIVTIHNTIDSTINFDYRIGDGPWITASLRPGYYRYYSHEYDYPGENRSPVLQLRFDSDMGPGVATREFRLERNPAPWVDPDFGRHYDFKYLAGNQISLYER